MICGEEAPDTNEVNFQQLLYEIRSVQGLYSKSVFRKAVVKLLNGTAAELVRYIGPQVKVKGIISKFETV